MSEPTKKNMKMHFNGKQKDVKREEEKNSTVQKQISIYLRINK